ncbi:YceI family protein [Cochleicola gelatinilyticus]|uniref:Lipid-binding protein n=1 Tax=Cochleicola gelatinilyticus TaxID=1763537 RepID=A0A167KBU1_9FLAO|nr:YceI family protein [Cochleicola gelatinilyticus]OAB81702.1 lipid-binding protein [Cochleicola gelatinilyticus]
MKTVLKSVLILAVTFGAASFTNTMTKRIDIKESTIEWKGKKVLGSHNGTINLQSGYLEIENEQLTGGEFVVDMTSINVMDLEGEGKEKLEGHLKSDDFFGIETYPTAKLVIKNATKNADGYLVNGDLTIKGETHPVNFDMDMGTDFASTTLKVDRTKFGVRYGSGSFFDNLGDNTISDTFELKVTLKF